MQTSDGLRSSSETMLQLPPPCPRHLRKQQIPSCSRIVPKDICIKACIPHVAAKPRWVSAASAANYAFVGNAHLSLGNGSLIDDAGGLMLLQPCRRRLAYVQYVLYSSDLWFLILPNFPGSLVPPTLREAKHDTMHSAV